MYSYAIELDANLYRHNTSDRPTATSVSTANQRSRHGANTSTARTRPAVRTRPSGPFAFLLATHRRRAGAPFHQTSASLTPAAGRAPGRCRLLGPARALPSAARRAAAPPTRRRAQARAHRAAAGDVIPPEAGAVRESSLGGWAQGGASAWAGGCVPTDGRLDGRVSERECERAGWARGVRADGRARSGRAEGARVRRGGRASKDGREAGASERTRAGWSQYLKVAAAQSNAAEECEQTSEHGPHRSDNLVDAVGGGVWARHACERHGAHVQHGHESGSACAEVDAGLELIKELDSDRACNLEQAVPRQHGDHSPICCPDQVEHPCAPSRAPAAPPIVRNGSSKRKAWSPPNQLDDTRAHLGKERPSAASSGTCA